MQTFKMEGQVQATVRATIAAENEAEARIGFRDLVAGLPAIELDLNNADCLEVQEVKAAEVGESTERSDPGWPTLMRRISGSTCDQCQTPPSEESLVEVLCGRGFTRLCEKCLLQALRLLSAARDTSERTETKCGCEGSCPVCQLGEVDDHWCPRCRTEFCPKCHGKKDGPPTDVIDRCRCESNERTDPEE